MKETSKVKTMSAKGNGITAFVHSKCRRDDGTFDSFRTQSVPVRVTEAPRRARPALVHGAAQPTQYMVLFNSRWRRVHVAKGVRLNMSYIGRTIDDHLTVQILHV